MNNHINRKAEDGRPGPGIGRQAIVIGGSLAGLLAARALSDHFERVTILERDSPADQPAPRKGVPQARHLHILLARGRRILEQLFPGLVEDLVACGAPVADMSSELAWLTPAGWGVRCDSGISIIGCSRDLLEWRVRQRLTAICGVRFYGGSDVTGLSTDDRGTQINGVKARVQDQSDRGGLLPGDLVVDASGRGSRAGEWLKQLGYEPPDETVVNAHLGYTSRVYRRHPRLIDYKGVYVQPAPPDYLRGGALFPIEGDRWILTLAGYGRDYPPTDEKGFVDFAQSLRTQLIYEAIKDAEPLSPIFTYRATENRLRHYERMSRKPEGFVVLGDAACAFNPVYAQGLTMAALGAVTLDECLRKQRVRDGGLSGFNKLFQEKLAKVNSAPWLIATGEDLRVPGCEGEPPGKLNLIVQRYFDRVVGLSTENAAVRKVLLEVFNMLKPPSTLFHPVLGIRLAAHLLLKAIPGGSSSPAYKTYHSHKQSRANDRPNDWETLAADVYKEKAR